MLPTPYHWRVRKDWKKEEMWVAWALPFLLCRYFWLIPGSNTSKTGYKKVSWLFMFLRMASISFKPANSGLNRNHGLLGLSVFLPSLFLSQRWPGIHLESCGTLSYTSWALELCVESQHDMWWEGEEVWTCIRCLFPFLTHVLRGPIQFLLQTQIQRSNYKNFETVVVEHFTGLGALETARVTPMKLALDSFWFLSFIHPRIGVMSNSVIFFSF